MHVRLRFEELIGVQIAWRGPRPNSLLSPKEDVKPAKPHEED